MTDFPSLQDIKSTARPDSELFKIGQYAQNLAEFDIAEYCFRVVALKATTNPAPIQTYLECLVKQYKFDTALKFVNRQMKKSTAQGFYRNWRARLYILLNKFELAEKDLLWLTSKDPNSPALQRNLALLYRDFDIRDKAAEQYLKVLSLDPENGEAFRLLMGLERQGYVSALAGQIEKDMLAGKRRNADHWFGLGKLYDDLGDGNRAWGYYERGNAGIDLSKARQFPKYLEMSKTLRDVIVSYVQNYGSDCIGKENAAPLVLINGFARSGTTMFENVLASDQRFQPCGELTICSTAETEMMIRHGGGNMPSILAKDHFTGFANTYNRVLSNLGAKGRIPIDKAINFPRMLGLFPLSMPNVRVLQPKRDPKDVIISNFKARFLADQSWSFDIGEIIQWMEFAFESMNIWQELFPDKVVTMSYDDYVGDPTFHNQKLASFFTFADKQPDFGFAKQDRAVMTATANQLGDRIRTDSKGKSAAFADKLAPWDKEIDRLYKLL